MKKNFVRPLLILWLINLVPARVFAAGWETFVPDWVVFAAFDASNEEIQYAVNRDNTLNTYMSKVLSVQKQYQVMTFDLINHARYAYGNKEDGSFSTGSSSLDADPVSSLKQFRNFYQTILNTVNYYSRLTGYLCNGDFSNPIVKAQVLECLLTQGYDAYVILDEYWNLKKEELQGGRIIQRNILWYIDVADNLNRRLSRINSKLYAQVRIVRDHRVMDKQNMQEWIRKRAEERVRQGVKDIIE